MLLMRFDFCLVLLLTGLAGCSEAPDSPAEPRSVSAEVSDIPTVVRVRWRTDVPTRGYVEYGTTRDVQSRTPLQAHDALEHSLLLLGLTEDTRYYFRVVSWDGANATASEVSTVTTATLPGGLPSLSAQGHAHDSYTLVPILGMKTGISIINPDGEIVWYHADDRALDVYRARLSVDGRSVVYNAASVAGDPSDASELVRVALDGSETSSIPVPLLAHDFVEHDDGTLAAVVVEYRDFEGSELRGDKIVEVSDTGSMKTVWSAWDCFDPADMRGDSADLGWTFANALDYSASQDAYYVGLRNFSSIVKVARATGECEWVLGLTGSTFDFAEGSPRFLHQHQFEVRGDRILIMDNDGSSKSESRVLEYQLDFEQNLATLVWSYVADPPVYTFVLGEPNRLGDGSTFINWSASGQLERVDPAGASVWKLNTNLGFVFGFHSLLTTLYAPP